MILAFRFESIQRLLVLCADQDTHTNYHLARYAMTVSRKPSIGTMKLTVPLMVNSMSR